MIFQKITCGKHEHLCHQLAKNVPNRVEYFFSLIPLVIMCIKRFVFIIDFKNVNLDYGQNAPKKFIEERPNFKGQFFQVKPLFFWNYFFRDI
jgi:hypothetical protein